MWSMEWIPQRACFAGVASTDNGKNHNWPLHRHLTQGRGARSPLAKGNGRVCAEETNRKVIWRQSIMSCLWLVSFSLRSTGALITGKTFRRAQFAPPNTEAMSQLRKCCAYTAKNFFERGKVVVKLSNWMEMFLINTRCSVWGVCFAMACYWKR